MSDENYECVAEVAKTLGISVPRFHNLIKQERVVGAKKFGSGRGIWMIPVDENGRPEILPSQVKPRPFVKISQPQ